MSVRIQIRRDTAANWAAANPVLADGEPAFEHDTRLFKLGDGSTAYNALAYETPPLSLVEHATMLVVNALDYLALNGSDDGPALNSLMSSLHAGLGTNETAIVWVPADYTLGLGTTVVRQPGVGLVSKGATIKVLSALNAGPVFTNSTSAPLLRSALGGFIVDKGGLTGTLFDTHSMQISEFGPFELLNGTSSCTNLTLYADGTTSTDGDIKTNCAGNVFHPIYDRGSCATAVLMSGLSTAAYAGATGPAVITNNTFLQTDFRGVFSVGWDFVQWCDDNVMPGEHTTELKANGAITARFNNSGTPSANAGVYCMRFGKLTTENYGAFTIQGIVLNYQRGLIVDDYFADPGVGSGTAVTDNFSQSHLIRRTGFPSSNLAYTYRKGFYEGYDETASATGPTMSLLKSRAGGIVSVSDILGQYTFNARLTAGETEAAKLQAIVTNTTSGSEKVELRIWTLSNASGGYAARFRFADNGQLGVGAATFAGMSGTLDVRCPGPAVVGLYVAGAASQTANLMTLNNGSSNVLQVDANGNLTGNGSNGLLKNFRRQMRKGVSSAASPSATANTYGTPVTFLPASGFYGLEVAQIRVTSGGTFGAETLTAQIVFTYSDASTQTDNKTFTATGVSADITNGEINLDVFKDGLTLVQVSLQVQSTIASSTATATMTVAAYNT